MFGAQEKNTTFRKKTKNMFQVLNLQQVHDIGPLFVSGALAKVINLEGLHTERHVCIFSRPAQTQFRVSFIWLLSTQRGIG